MFRRVQLAQRFEKPKRRASRSFAAEFPSGLRRLVLLERVLSRSFMVHPIASKIATSRNQLNVFSGRSLPINQAREIQLTQTMTLRASRHSICTIAAPFVVFDVVW